MSELNYELAPRQGMPASQRKAELDAARFVAVRNLAYMQYKKPDGSALLTYQETLGDREQVKMTIVQHEIAQGLIVNDLGAPAGAPPQQMQPTGAPTNGATQTIQPAASGYGAPMSMTIAPGVGQSAAPQMQPAPGAAPAPAAYAAPLGVAPAAASPQQAAQAAQEPQPQPQPEQGAPTGRKRRSAVGGAPQAGGVAVAPPPTGMPAPAQMMPSAAPQAAAPGMSLATPGAGPAPAMNVPATPTGAPVGGGHTASGSAPGHIPHDAIALILQKLDDLGRGLTAISKDLDELAQRQTLDEAMLGKVHVDTLQALAALHHIYGSTPNLVQALQQKNVQTLDQFRSYLTPNYTGNP